MPQRHPEPRLLERFVAGELSQRESLKVAWHLSNCPGCRRAANSVGGDALVERLLGTLAGPGESHEYDDAISRAYGVLLNREADLERERSRAPQLMAELEGHPLPRQMVLVHNTRRFQTWGLAELLLSRTASAWLEEPEQAEDLSELALAVAQRLDPEVYKAALIEDLEGRCWVHVANSRRVIGDLPGAAKAFRAAAEHLGRGTEDPVEWARFHYVQAALFREQGRLGEAQGALRRAAAIYRRVGDRHELGKVLFSLSRLQAVQGEPGRAINTLKRSVGMLDTRREPHLALGARYNLIHFLSDAERYMEAQALLTRSRDLFRRHANTHLRLRLPWLKGKIALGLGQVDQAEAAYLAAREGFLARGREVSIDAALISLELALLYARHDRAAEAEELARATLPLFEALELQHEATAAAMVLERAVDARRLSAAVFQEVLTRLQTSRSGSH